MSLYVSARLEPSADGKSIYFVTVEGSDPDVEAFTNKADAVHALKDFATLFPKFFVEWRDCDAAGEPGGFQAWALASRANWPAFVNGGRLDVRMFGEQAAKFIYQQFASLKGGIDLLSCDAGAAFLKAAYQREKPVYASVGSDVEFIGRFAKEPLETYRVGRDEYRIYPDCSIQYPSDNSAGIGIHDQAYEWLEEIQESLSRYVARSTGSPEGEPWFDESEQMLLLLHHDYRFRKEEGS